MCMHAEFLLSVFISVSRLIQEDITLVVAVIQAVRVVTYAVGIVRTVARVEDIHHLWVVQMVVQLVVAHRGVSAVDLDYVLVSGCLDLPVDRAIAIVILGNHLGHGIACAGLDCNDKTH